jgi:phage-related minor tail protein
VANEIGTAYVGIEFDRKGVESQLSGLGGGLGKQFSGLGSTMGAGLKAGLVGAAAGAAVAVGKYLYDIGASFDAMADTISTTTGASGKELEGLVEIAKEVGTEVPMSFEDAGTAVGELAAKTGLAGKPLKNLTVQVTSLAKVTGEDLGQTIESSTRLLGDWGLTGAKAAEGMDTLFKASQETGVGTSRLAELMTKFGGPFRQLGFGFTESAALLGKWQKEGVNTELVAGSMRIALGKFAKAGREPGEAFRETVEKMQKLGPGAESLGLAMETFGAKAGPDMAAAILEGRFAIDDLVGKIEKSKSTIKGAEVGTRDFAEQWTIFKNQVALVLAPLAEKMFAAIGDGMRVLSEELPAVIAMLKEDFGPAFEEISTAITELMPLFETLLGVAMPIVQQMIAGIRLMAEVISGVVQLVSALLRGDWSAAWDAAKQIFGAFATYFKSSWENLKSYLSAVLGIFSTLATSIGRAISDGIMALVRPIAGLVQTAFNAVVSAIRGVLSAAGSAASAIGNAVKTAIMTPVNAITGLVRTLFNGYVAIIRGVVGLARSAANAVGDAILGGLRSGLSTIKSVVSSALGKIFDAITTVAGYASGWAMSIGKAIVAGVLSGLANLFNEVKDKIVGAVSGAIGWARDNLGSTAEEYAAANLGKPVMDGVIRGIVSGTKELSDSIAQSVRTAVDAGRAEIENARAGFGESWGRLAGDALSAFDAISAGVQTKHEKILAKMEAQRAASAARMREAAAREALAVAEKPLEAVEGETPEALKAREDARNKAIADAKQALDDVLYEKEKARLEKLAAEERRQENARIARKRRNFEDELAALQENLAKTGASQGEAHKKILALFEKFGVDYKAAGKALGKSFGSMLKESVEDAAADIRRILRELLEAIEEVRKANQGVKAEAPKKKGAPAPATLAVAPATAALGATPFASSSTGGGLAGPVPLGQRLRRAGFVQRTGGGPSVDVGGFEIRVYIGDEELRGMVRTEVVRGDTNLARTLLTGGRV